MTSPIIEGEIVLVESMVTSNSATGFTPLNDIFAKPLSSSYFSPSPVIIPNDLLSFTKTSPETAPIPTHEFDCDLYLSSGLPLASVTFANKPSLGVGYSACNAETLSNKPTKFV